MPDEELRLLKEASEAWDARLRDLEFAARVALPEAQEQAEMWEKRAGELEAVLEGIAARDYYPRGWHVSRGGGHRMPLHELQVTPPLPHDQHCPGCIAERALGDPNGF